MQVDPGGNAGATRETKVPKDDQVGGEGEQAEPEQCRVESQVMARPESMSTAGTGAAKVNVIGARV